MSKEIVSTLSDKVLTRLYFRYLEQRYSAGGVNCRRSLRGLLLECYLDLVDVPLIEGVSSLEEISISDVLSEATLRSERKKEESSQGELPFPVTPLEERLQKGELSTIEAAYLSIACLWHWYKGLSEDELWEDGHLGHKKELDIICPLLPLQTSELTPMLVADNYRLVVCYAEEMRYRENERKYLVQLPE